MTMPALTGEQLQVVYRKMRMIRAFEEKLSELVTAGKLGGFLHLSAGQEAVAAGVCAHLTERDYVATTHRGHGHCIAKGVRIKGMMAELFGRSTGTVQGQGRLDAHRRHGPGHARRQRHRGCRHPAGHRRGAHLQAASRPAVWPSPSSATVRATRGSSTSRSTWRRTGSSRPSTSSRTTAGASSRRPSSSCPSRTSRCAPTAYAMRKAIADGMDFFDVYEKAGEAVERCAQGRGADAARVQDLPLLRALRRRPALVPLPGRGRRVEERRAIPLDRFRARVVERWARRRRRPATASTSEVESRSSRRRRRRRERPDAHLPTLSTKTSTWKES